ncbi:hypothetical protein NPIL_386041 [Nephila pilipes]|uniref:Uncharacterized protein n=1 Tax=Nephila pilipes TaxID=299642 RepID=A0A8X6Q142_NEPPI|nr:hypothetical protein NPIL_386041 [Nephila pilipes]
MVGKSEDTLAPLLRNLTVVHKRNISLSWLFSQRHENFGWGDETPRMLTALYLSDAKSLLQKNTTDMLMIKQLEMQLLLAMVK